MHGLHGYYEWREKERQILKDICICYGIETKTKAEEQANYRGETLSVDVYSNAMRDAKADAEVIKESAKIGAKHIRKEAESERHAAEQLRQNQEQLIQQDAERITREAVRKSHRERKEYEEKQAECDKLKADYEKAKKNLGYFIWRKSVELVKMAFPEIEQEKLATKIKKLDETARQNLR